VPAELAESLFFGHRQGAFSGASKDKKGYFELADGGTIFLDEVGDMIVSAQAKVLRVLQSGEFNRVGGELTLKADVRVLAATNRDLAAAVQNGGFREDLYFRLNVIELAVPPLSERREDVLPLARSVLAELSQGRSGEPLTLSREAEEALRSHAWPGNVRELFNRIQRAAVVAPLPALTPADLGFAGGTVPHGEAADPGEKRSVEEVLRRHGGSVSRAAAEPGIPRQKFHRKTEKLGIVLERRPRE
jgi:transcriptional regulator with GAF, ATPase, and Fis domain